MLRSIGAVFRMLVQPAEVYPLIRERSPLAGPMLLVAAVGVLAAWMIVPNLQELARQQLALQPELPAEASAFAATATLWSALIGGAVGPIFYALLTAAILALGMLFTGGTLRYRQAFSLSLFAYAPLLLSTLLGSGMVMAGVVTNVTEAVTSAALVLGPEAAGTWPYRLLDLIAPFEWWHIGLLAGGVRHLADTSPRTAWALAVAVWLLLYASVTLIAGPLAF